MLPKKLLEYGGGFAPEGTTTVNIEVHSWDFALALVYTIILLINVVGVAKYALRAHTLTLFIMISNFAAICFRESLFVYLFANQG